ncbi:MAG TPA: hypothetical protein DER33_02165 [Syntrophomonas sp.]|nr:hypothetical protein [Syntrophomonas sp.]HCF70393.1 hypothetical protein [Syntrophomonas sp.]
MTKEAGTDDKQNQVVEELAEKVEELSTNIQKMRLAEYLEMLEHPRRLFYINFLLGIARGFGSAIGFTILAGIVVYILQKIVVLNMPIIGSFIANIVEIVQRELNVGGVIFQNPGKI